MKRPSDDCRKTTARRLLYGLALPWVLAAGLPAVAADRADSGTAQAQLATVREHIEELTKRRAEELRKRDAVAAKLRQADLAITDQRRALDALRAAVAVAETRRNQARGEQARTRAELEAERAALAAQIVTAYRMGRQEQIKLLLSQSDPATFGRMLTYAGYLGRERGAQINAIRSRQQRLDLLAAETLQRSARLKTLQEDAQHQLGELEKSRQERVLLLAAIANQVKTGDQNLADLKHQEQALEALLTDLSPDLEEFPTGTQRPFEQWRGKLPWPVAGHLVAGSHELPNGVLIEAAKGAKVRAPFGGRVVYADWLQGLGLLLIVSHGGGYLSLYGHAEVLYKAVGDTVSAGDVVAALRDDDGKPPQLYFEIRAGKKPVETRQWLKREP
jgi:septal ring factor EnvC (AmiA/AmiB activator)